MARVKTFSLKGKATKESVALPSQFETPYRPDVIKRAVLAVQSRRYQPHGVDELAGKRNTAQSWQTGHGKSRMPRVKGSGTSAANKAAFAPGTVGGRVAHPPESRKVIVERINNKENRLAIRLTCVRPGNSLQVLEEACVIALSTGIQCLVEMNGVAVLVTPGMDVFEANQKYLALKANEQGQKIKKQRKKGSNNHGKRQNDARVGR